MAWDHDHRDRHDDGEEPEEQDHRVPLGLPGEPVELAVQNSSGEVTIRTADREDILVHSEKGGRTESRRYRESRLRIDVRGNRVEVRPEMPAGGGWAGVAFGRGRGRRDEDDGEEAPGRFGLEFDVDALRDGGGRGKVHYDLWIELPRAVAASVAVRTASGDVRVEGVRGRLDAATASGEVEVRDLAGDLTAHSASGDVRVDGLTGAATVRTASGDVELARAALPAFGVTTVSGDVRVEGRLAGAGPFRGQSVSGDFTLELAPRPAGTGGPALALELQTVSGDAEVDPALARVGKRTYRLGGERTDADRLSVKTVSGDLHFRLLRPDQTRAAAGAPTPDAPTAPIRGAWDVPAPPEPPAPPPFAPPPTPAEFPPPPPPPVPEGYPGEAQDRAIDAMVDDTIEQAMRGVEDEMHGMDAMIDASVDEAMREATRELEAELGEAGPDQPHHEPAPAPVAVAADGEGASPAAPEAVRGDAQLGVLEALERGEIDIEEAMRRLDALDAPVAP